MGCAASKLRDSPPVLLCRQRCDFLDEAIHHRFAFARYHAAYIQSLNALGVSLQNFFAGDLQPSPEIRLPKRSKGEPDSPENFHHIHSRSHSGSHLHFHSDDESDSDDYDWDSLHRMEERQPTIEDGRATSYGYFFDQGFIKLNYMKNQATPSMLYTQKPIAQTLPLAQQSSSSYFSSKFPVDDDFHQNLPPYLNGYSNHRFVGEGYYPPSSSSKPQPAPAPPPPSPPRTTAWDFLNPFHTFDNYYPDEWREEGMPDLEYDEEEEEVVKEVHGDPKFVGTSSSKEVEDSGPPSSSINADGEAGPSVVSSEKKMEYSSQKNVIDDGERPKAKVNNLPDSDPIKEVQIQFQRVSESGSEIAEFLEVGKLRHKPNHTVPTRLLHLPAALSLRISTLRNSTNEDSQLSDLNQRAKNLSSTLHEIYLWEKKLYQEVKSEEKLRVVHQRKSKKFVSLDRKGAEAQRVDNTRTLLRSLSTKIDMAIQVVDRISRKINGLRDAELCPQLYDFIHGLTRMWKSMFESHRAQGEAIQVAKELDGTPRLDVIYQLENDLIDWATSFTHWFTAQRRYVQALNNWLLKCLLYIPEEEDTPDGPAPFSPGRLGAPPIFVICHQWSQSLDRVSDHEVVASMQELTTGVLHMGYGGKSSDPKVRKEMESLERRIGKITSSQGGGSKSDGRAVFQSETKKKGVGGGLARVFEAMEKLAGDCLKVYEELQQCILDIHHTNKPRTIE